VHIALPQAWQMALGRLVTRLPHNPHAGML